MITVCLVLVASAFSVAAEKKHVAKKTPKTMPAVQIPVPVTVAVLDYEGTLPGNKDLGTQIADILTARLSIEESFALVERAKLGKILDEHKLKLIGVVDQTQSAKVGKLLGARLLVMGKVFMMGKSLMIVTKVVGVETGRVKGTFRTVKLTTPLSEAIMLLSGDVATLIKKNAARLLPKGPAMIDTVAAIRKKLGNAPRPTVAVVVVEEHKAHRATPVIVIDPAVETEIKRTLIACGFKIVDIGKNDLTDWSKKMMKGKKPPWPSALGKADYVIVGEAFSEFALRTGDLVTCAARAEINVIDRKTGKIVLADRHTDRAVDLAEAIAGKTALQKAGRILAIRTLKHFAKTLTPKPPKVAKDKVKKAAKNRK
jgi:TolB-like protein